MAQIALPRQQAAQTSPSAAVGSPLYQRRRQSNTGPIELMPNPDFTFPMRPDRTSSEPATSNPRPTAMQSYPAARRGSTPGGMKLKPANALPNFSFNPAASSQSGVTASPPQSPFSIVAPTTPSRPIGGHRRGGSEFIGGDGRAGASNLLSTSPTKGDGILPPPATLRPGPPPGRRGHAHRRSGAISSHDLTTIMNPPSGVQAGSAPVTPLESPKFSGHSVNKSISQPSLRGTALQGDVDSTPRPPSRARVGFSDKVEYIRPLSTISSETETSLTTIRGHSATNSLSSVLSAGVTSPGRTTHQSPSAAREQDSRPSTAGAILDLGKSAFLDPDMANRKRPSSAISHTPVASPTSASLPAKRRSFFRLESRRSDTSVPTLTSSASDPTLTVPLDSPLPSPSGTNSDFGAEPGKVKGRKSSRTPRKVKSWANSIIPKKSKNGKKGKGRVSTPPPESPVDVEETDTSEELDFDAIFDVDNTVTIVSPTEDTFTESEPQADYASWTPRELKRVDSDVKSPVIDLDAALGPFNTPQGQSSRVTYRGFGAHRRAMHSAGGVSQSHRRTESAPELVPFDFRTSSGPTPSTMADVFEEEEEEPDDQASSTTTQASREEQEEVEEPKILVVEADGLQDGMIWNFNDGLGIKHEEPREFQSDNPNSSSLDEAKPDLKKMEPTSTNDIVEVVEDFEEPRTSSLTQSSDSTITAPVASEESKERQSMLNISLPLPQQTLMTPDTFTSSFSSPDYRSSQASFDTPRLGTAASSMTDYAVMPSPRFGDPGLEVRTSVDDVPSLTSSRSTMTSAMHNTFPLQTPRRPGDRSASLCSAPSDVESRRRKRSSIASLSRLINHSSFGERSKLSHEVRPQSEYLEPTHKDNKKKHKRLSKLMQFWKPKDSPCA